MFEVKYLEFLSGYGCLRFSLLLSGGRADAAGGGAGGASLERRINSCKEGGELESAEVKIFFVFLCFFLPW